MKSRVLSTIFFFLLFCMSTAAQDVSQQESRKARLEKEIELLDQQIREADARNKDALAVLSLTRKKISSRKELVRESDREISRINGRITAKQREINATRERLETLTSQYNKLLGSAYKHRDSRVWYMYILASDNIAQGFHRYSYFKNLSLELNNQGVRVKEMQQQLEQEKQELQDMRKEAEAVRAERVREMDKLRLEEKDAEKQVNTIQKNRSRYQSELNSKKKQVDALNKEIAKIIADAMKAGSGSKSSNKTPVEIDYKLGGDFKANKGKLPWPVEGPVMEHFGKQYNSLFRNLKMPDNNGVTVATAKNATVKAVYDGTVKSIIVMPGYNQCVLVQHGNYFTFYCKLSSVAVKSGDKVKTGDKIGVVDTISGETQFHFEVWEGSKPQNPENWLRPR